jgi:uncharacterized protein (TIGR02271 family)
MTSPQTPPRATGTPIIDAIRHEQQLHVTTERRGLERVRLERVIVTEQRTITVDVSHEELRFSREPIVDGEVIPDREVRSRDPIVLVLHEEQIAVSRTVVPVERVTLTTRTVTEERQISETVGHEEFDVEHVPESS